MAMLSSLLPNKRGFTLITCSVFTTMRTGKSKFPFVQRLATNVSPGSVAGLAIFPVINHAQLHPLQRSLDPYPDVAHDQDAEKDQHLDQSEHTQRLELDRPGK